MNVVVVATALFLTLISVEGLRETTKVFLVVENQRDIRTLFPLFLETHNILFQPHVNDQYEYSLIRSK